MNREPRLVEVRKNILKQNDLNARELRAPVSRGGCLRGQPGLEPGRREDDAAGEDAGRAPPSLPRRGARGRPRHRARCRAPRIQLERRCGRSPPAPSAISRPRWCRLGLEGWELDRLDFLFVENVGNLVCPASYDLGESLRFVAVSVTEGEDKPLKYPTIFNTSDIALITKIDLADAVGFDSSAALASVQSVRPGMKVLQLSAKTGEGMSDFIELLEAGLGAARGDAAATAT